MKMVFSNKNYFYQLQKPDFVYSAPGFVKEPKEGDVIDYNGNKFIIKKLLPIHSENIILLWVEKEDCE